MKSCEFSGKNSKLTYLFGGGNFQNSSNIYTAQWHLGALESGGHGGGSLVWVSGRNRFLEPSGSQEPPSWPRAVFRASGPFLPYACFSPQNLFSWGFGASLAVLSKTPVSPSEPSRTINLNLY